MFKWVENMGFNFYAWNLSTVLILVAASVCLWTVLQRWIPRRVWRWGGAVVLAAGVFLILWLTVLNREPSEEHVFTWAAAHMNEFFREMFMNAVLYVPFGLAACGLFGHWGVVAGLGLSLSIEIWQYFAGTGLAQGTDVLCNTLGAAVGMLPVWANRRLTRK